RPLVIPAPPGGAARVQCGREWAWPGHHESSHPKPRAAKRYTSTSRCHVVFNAHQKALLSDRGKTTPYPAISPPIEREDAAARARLATLGVHVDGEGLHGSHAVLRSAQCLSSRSRLARHCDCCASCSGPPCSTGSWRSAVRCWLKA